jgi:hypothetical protein
MCWCRYLCFERAALCTALEGNPIMKWHRPFSGPLALAALPPIVAALLPILAALLLPVLAVAESHIQTVPVNGALRTTAHVDFKIIIPKTLSLDVGTESRRSQGAPMVAIISNNRTVTLGVTVSTGRMVCTVSTP